jgi:AraC-like DNA-binding protein
MQSASQTNSELLDMLNQSYRSDYQKRQSDRNIIETSGGICYNVELGGSLGTVCAGISTVAPKYEFNLSDYPFHRIVFTISGQVQVLTGSGNYVAEPGSVYYFPPKKAAVVSNMSSNRWKLAYVHFTGVEAENIISKAVRASAVVWNTSNPGLIQTLFESIVDASLEHCEESQVICDSYLRILLTRLNAMLSQSSEHQTPSRLKYLECYNFINRNFSDIVSINDIAKKCHINGIYLCRLFKKYSNSSPMAYVSKLKMNKAALLLMQTDYSIKQISIMLTFSDPYYFSKAFKRIYGISPQKYRDTK